MLSVDALHAYFGVCGLSLMNEVGLRSMCAALSVSQRAADKLAEIHKSWTSLQLCPQPDFFRDRHAAFLQRCVTTLTEQRRTKDSSTWVTCAYFCDI